MATNPTPQSLRRFFGIPRTCAQDKAFILVNGEDKLVFEHGHEFASSLLDLVCHNEELHIFTVEDEDTVTVTLT